MNTKEFRIGNILREKNSGELIQVVELNEDTITFTGSFDGEWQAEPIMLTEEILLSICFVNDHPWKYKQFVLDDESRFHVVDQTGYGTIIAREITSVHQLQNLCFALTGQELNTSKLI